MPETLDQNINFFSAVGIAIPRRTLDDNIFNALHGMQTRSSDDNSVRTRLSVRLSVCQTRAL